MSAKVPAMQEDLKPQVQQQQPQQRTRGLHRGSSPEADRYAVVRR